MAEAPTLFSFSPGATQVEDLSAAGYACALTPSRKAKNNRLASRWTSVL